MERAILWDFDGTLAERPGLWGGCLVETLDEHEPGHGITAEELRPFLRSGFPWHVPDEPHPELGADGAWWRRVEALLAAAYEGVGIDPARAAELAGHARARYVDCSRSWRLFDDTLPALEALGARGWRHAILSNHVPELPVLVDGLGLGALVEVVLTSAAIGYEKPHPEAFRLALRACGDPAEVWMVGDNPIADIEGAEAVGIRAIRVRNGAATLADVVGIVAGESPVG